MRAATRHGVFMLNLHASGGLAVMRAGAEAAAKGAHDFGVPSSVEAPELHLAGVAREAGLDGCVASAHEISPLRLAMGPAWVIVTPGIRPASGEERRDDQVRVATPRRALAAGANYLVVGRPITGAHDPAVAASAILAELAAP